MRNRFEETSLPGNLPDILKLAKRVAFGVVGFLIAVIVGFNMVQNLDASHIMVIQSPIKGTLTWHTTQGWKYQGFGKVTTYKKRHQFDFNIDRRDDSKTLATRFNDNGRAKIPGSLSWEMPTAIENLNALHSKYGSDEAIEQQIIRTTVEKVVTMTGPLMSSTESFATRRNDLLSLILDQIQHGVYKTDAREAKVKDEMTGQDKTIKVVSLIPSTAVGDNAWARQEPSALDEFKIHAFNLSLGDLLYDEDVTKQIQAQQSAIMQVQTAIAESKKAEQAAITAAKNGEAEAAKAKWEQEVIKARAVTEAEQKKAVASLDAETALLRKREQILLGEGEAERRKLVMAADGALDKKLEAWIKVNEFYANAISKYTGAWVPSVQMGGGNVGSNGAQNMIDLMTLKTAKDLGLDLGVKK